MEVEKKGILERNTKARLDDHPGATAASLLTDDLILEVLSRLPARSLHRFKGVSMRWRDLITDPANRNMLPQTLAGFLYTTYNYLRERPSERPSRHRFASVSGDGAAPFDPCLQPSKYKDMVRVDACNGLLLYRCCSKNKVNRWSWAEDVCRFVVCNPATGRWVELPPLPPKPPAPASRHSCTVGLAFDPAVSSHFHVLCFAQGYKENCISGVSIYSSQAGAWIHRNSGTVEKVNLFFESKCVFVGGTMYLLGNLYINNECVLVGVDMEGKLWTTIRVPYRRIFGAIGSSQGCLHYAMASVDDDNNKVLVSEIALWCLKDRDSKELVLKRTASINKLMSMTGQRYEVVGIHPDCDTIFLVPYELDTLVSYDMRHQKVGCILNLEKDNAQQFLPYVPLFSESLAVADGR